MTQYASEPRDKAFFYEHGCWKEIEGPRTWLGVTSFADWAREHGYAHVGEIGSSEMLFHATVWYGSSVKPAYRFLLVVTVDQAIQLIYLKDFPELQHFLKDFPELQHFLKDFESLVDEKRAL